MILMIIMIMMIPSSLKELYPNLNISILWAVELPIIIDNDDNDNNDSDDYDDIDNDHYYYNYDVM